MNINSGHDVTILLDFTSSDIEAHPECPKFVDPLVLERTRGLVEGEELEDGKSLETDE